MLMHALCASARVFFVWIHRNGKAVQVNRIRVALVFLALFVFLLTSGASGRAAPTTSLTI